MAEMIQVAVERLLINTCRWQIYAPTDTHKEILWVSMNKGLKEQLFPKINLLRAQ